MNEETDGESIESTSFGGASGVWQTRARWLGVVAAVAAAAFALGRCSGDGAESGADEAAVEDQPGASGSGTEEASEGRYTCPMHPDVRSDDPDGTCPICGMDLVPVEEASGGSGGEMDHGAATSDSGGGVDDRAQQYTCPMHPDVRSDDPDDTCPICGMDLVPVGEESSGSGDSGGPSLELSERAVELAKVRTAEADRRSVTRDIRAYGRVEMADETLSDITAWVRGRIERLDLSEEGEHVRAGQRVARLYSPKLENVQQEMLQALRSAESAEADGSEGRAERARSAADAARERLRVLGLKPSQIDGIASEREVRRVVDLRAESSGMIHRLHVSQGEWVDEGDPLASLHSHRTLWIQLEIYEEDLPFVEEGTPVEVTFPGQPGRELSSRIDFVRPIVDTANGTARARVVVPDADESLPIGADVRAYIRAPVEADPPPVSVPASAVLWTGPRSLVYRYDRSREPPAFVPRQVELGPKVGDRRVIREGLAEGDEVATNGAFQIDAELQIRGEPSMMTGSTPSEQTDETVDVPEDGGELDPPVDPAKIPDGAWYCPMESVHWVQPGERDGECPVCGMDLEQKSAAGGSDDDQSEHSHGEGGR